MSLLILGAAEGKFAMVTNLHTGEVQKGCLYYRGCDKEGVKWRVDSIVILLFFVIWEILSSSVAISASVK